MTTTSDLKKTAKHHKLGDKATKPKPGIPLDKDTILRLIGLHQGNLSRVADSLGTTRLAVRNRINEDINLTQALEDARERKLDRLEEAVWHRAEESNDTGIQAFILKTQGRHRGWDQSEANQTAKDIASAAFAFIMDKSKSTT